MKEIVELLEEKDRFIHLLLLADPDLTMIHRYLDQSRVFVLMDDSTPLCQAAMLDLGNGMCECKNLATDASMQNNGYASYLLSVLCTRFKDSHHTMLVGTSESGVGFYRRLGFTISHVKKGFFLEYPEPIYENGKQLTDMIYLRKEL
ncbi:MAG: GNAT family N-acetyltransferase [Clostridiales bacterium]|nr:GNAT family N-acetyltransferase [Clostridiales bacterium]